MKISYKWLKNYIDFDVDPQKLSEILTNTGLEVEGMEEFESVKGGLEGIVIGKVLSCEKHPAADKLSLTKVDIGAGEPLDIVCGAPNVAEGQKVIVAPVGTTLYFGEEPFKIKKAKIRGEISEGMICAEDEVGLGTSHDGILVLDEDVPIGIKAKEYFKIEKDWVYEIGLTPNRSDATSHIGTARDIVAALNQIENPRKYKLKLPDVGNFNVDNTNLKIKVIIEDTEACPRFSGVTISNLKVKESPVWLQNYLNAIGIRPINNIVDITNFVLMEYGQPLHAYDAKKIKGNKVVVKKLPDKTPFITLAEEERKLSKEDLMICDAKGGMCIAGVFGGTNTGVTDQTTEIFLESAYFDSVSIRKTAKRHDLQTDASFRFERGTDPNITVDAMKRAALLIRELAEGEISSEIVDVYPNKIDNKKVSIDYFHVDRLIGKKINRAMIKNILLDLGIEIIEDNEEGLLLSVPPFKNDVTREADVIEEILRIYGYNNIELSDQLRSSLSFIDKPDPEKIRNIVSGYLTGNGFYEMMSNSLTNSKYTEFSEIEDTGNNVKMMNPISQDLDVLRQNLLFGGLEAIAYNQNRKANDLKLYELGNIYKLISEKNADVLDKYFEEEHLGIFICGAEKKESWATNENKTDIFFLKAYLENIFRRLGVLSELSTDFEVSGQFTEGIRYKNKKIVLAEAGSVAPHYLTKFDIKQKVFYADIHFGELLKLTKALEPQYVQIPKFPAVRRDLALLLDKNIKFEQIKEIAFSTEKNLLKSVNLFDIYEGDKFEKDKKSYAVSFILQNPEKTLTDKLVDKIMNKIIQNLKKEINASIR